MELSILQWNIWCDEDVNNIVEFLKQHKADFICLQELTLNNPKQSVKNAPEYIAKELGYNCFFKELPIQSTKGEAMRIANGIFSKYPILKTNFCWTNLPDKSSGYNNEKRVYVEAAFGIGDKELTVGTTHMSYTHKFEPTPQKLKETDKLLKFIAKHQNKFVIAGDFNAAPGSYVVNNFEQKYQNLGPDFNQNTWATKPFSYNGFEENKLNWRLDHVFGTKDIKLINSRVLKTEFSDHLPIMTTIDL